MGRGGYWNNWIVVRTPGKAEQRYQTEYFINEVRWFDDHRVIYEQADTRMYTIDVTNGKTELVAGPRP